MKYRMDTELKPETLARLLSKYTEAEQEMIRDHLWKRPSSYIGAQWFGSIGVVGRSRDSGALERSNFEVAFEQLGGKETQTVFIESANHWACGWVESLRVHISNVKRTKQALEILRALDQYPVLDDSHFSQTEWDEATETIQNNASEFQRKLFRYLGFKDESRDTKNAKRAADIGELVDAIYREYCGYAGPESAWVCEKSCRHFFERNGYALQSLADHGNKIARAIINAERFPVAKTA